MNLKNNYLVISVFILILLGTLYFVSHNLRTKLIVTGSPSPTALTLIASPTPNQVLGLQTKTVNCQIMNSLPDPACTPGAVFPSVTKDQVCTPGYASSVRDVPQAEKNQVFTEYNLPTKNQPGQYEVDHLISLELGGSNEISNLFPQPAEPRPGYHEKDKVENYLHDQVCKGAITLEQAQLEISQNWLEVYNQIAK
jgi:hypothetical protein